MSNPVSETFIVSAIALFLLSVFQGAILILQNRLIKSYARMIEDKAKKEDPILIYCLSFIASRAVDDEDYEKAAKCTELINSLKKNIQTT